MAWQVGFFCGFIVMPVTPVTLGPLHPLYSGRYTRYTWQVGFFGGNVKLLLDDVAALGPTVFVGVPRVFQRVYDKGIAGINAKSPKVAGLLMWALEKEMAACREGSHTLWNALFKKIFRKVRREA